MSEELQAQGFSETPQGTQLYEQAIEILYSDNIEGVLKRFEGLEGNQIPPALSNVVNTAIKRLEQDTGQALPVELAAEVGSRLLVALIEDLTQDKIIPELTEQQMAGAVADVLNDYALSHKDTVSPEQFKQFLEQLGGQPVDIGQGGQTQAQPQAQGPAPTPSQPQAQEGLIG